MALFAAWCFYSLSFVLISFFKAKIALVWLSLSSVYLLFYKHGYICMYMYKTKLIYKKSQGMYTRYFKVIYQREKMCVIK